MLRPIQVSRVAPGTAPLVKTCVFDAAEDCLRGSPVSQDTDEEMIECADNPTSAIFGFVAEDVTDGKPAFGDEAVVELAHDSNTFLGKLVNGSDTVVAVAASDDNQSYGLRKRADGTWAVDRSRSGAVRIVDIDLDLDLVFFRVLAAARQQDV